MTLLAAITDASQTDLQEIDTRTQLLEAELAFLKSLRGIVAAKCGAAESVVKKPARVATKPGGNLTDLNRDRVRQYLLTHGCTRRKDLIEALGIPEGSMSVVMKHKWFEFTADGFVVTADSV